MSEKCSMNSGIVSVIQIVKKLLFVCFDILLNLEFLKSLLYVITI